MSNFSPNNEISIEEGVQLFERQAAAAIATLAQKGFTMPTPPTYTTNAGTMAYRGELPQNLPELSDQQLGFYLGLLQQWNEYVQCQLAEADVHLHKAKAIYEHVEAKLRLAYQREADNKKRSNPERDDYVRSDRRYLEAQSQVMYWEGLYRYIRAISNASSNAWDTVSRRITQRGQEIDRLNRGGNVTGHTNNIAPGPLFPGRRT